MDEKNKKDPVFIEAQKYQDYFAEDSAELEALLQRLTKLQGISDQQIDNISEAAPGRGTQHYLIEHITNAISIQNQVQSVLKDKRSIKENALNIALKNMRGEDLGDEGEILASLQKMIKEQKQKIDKLEDDVSKPIIEKTDEEIDDEIEKRLDSI